MKKLSVLIIGPVCGGKTTLQAILAAAVAEAGGRVELKDTGAGAKSSQRVVFPRSLPKKLHDFHVVIDTKNS